MWVLIQYLPFHKQGVVFWQYYLRHEMLHTDVVVFRSGDQQFREAWGFGDGISVEKHTTEYDEGISEDV